MHSLWCLYDTVLPMTMWNNFSFCCQLSKNTTGEEIFKKVDLFFQEHQLSWADCVCAFAYGAQSIMGIKKGFEFCEKGKQ